MKKLLIVFAVLAALALVGLAILDNRVQAFAEANAEQRVAGVLPDSQGVVVRIDSWPILWSVLRGGLDHVTVTADSVTREGVRADELELVVHGIELDTAAMWSDRKLRVRGIERAVLQGTMSASSISKRVGATVVLTPGIVQVSRDGQTFVATVEVDGRHVVLKSPIPGVEPMKFGLPPRDLLPCQPDLKVLDGKLALHCEVTELPGVVRYAVGE